MLVYQCDKCGSTGSEVYGITSNNVTTDACEECLSEALVALAWKGDYNTVRAFTGAEVVEGNPMLIDGEPYTWD